MRRLLLLLVIGFSTEALADHVTIYDDDVTVYQTGKRIDSAKSGKLKIFVCEDHFPAGSTARDEVYRSVKAFNDAPGVKVHLEIKYGPHKNKAALYASPPQYDFSFEYVDNVNSAADPGNNPCHANGSIGCSDWTMNTCHYDGAWPAAGSISSHVVFAVNQYCYAPLDPSREYPLASGITHEFGHGFGLKHGPDRTVEGVEFQTIMAQTLDFVTTYDLAHLLTYYPATAATEVAELETSEWVASPAIRYYDGTGALVTGDFASANPKDLYLDTGLWHFLDCNTGAHPIYQANFLEMSTGPYEMTNSTALAYFEVASEKTDWVFDGVFGENIATVTVNGDMSQTLITSVNGLYDGLIINQGTFAVWPMVDTQPAKVRFRIDGQDTFAERNEDNNTVEMDINLHPDVSYCP